MSNMSYCRFENTNRDLKDCEEALSALIGAEITKLSEDELRAAKSLGATCLRIVEMMGEAVNKSIEDLDESDIDEAIETINNPPVEDDED